MHPSQVLRRHVIVAMAALALTAYLPFMVSVTIAAR
jgi:hypothetical protein